MLNALTILWCAHAALALIFVAPMVWLARLRVRWSWWEALAFLMPFSAWASLMLGDWVKRPKSMGNLGEFWLVSIAIVVAFAIRVLLGGRSDGVGARVILLATATAAAAGVYLMTPMWPE